jgi:hypothetical protein
MSSTSEVFQSTFKNLLGKFSGGATPPDVKELNKMFGNMSINSPPKDVIDKLSEKLSKMKLLGSPGDNAAKVATRPAARRFGQPFVHPVGRPIVLRPVVPKLVARPAVHPRFARPSVSFKGPRLSPIIEESPPKESKRQRSPTDDSNSVKKSKNKRSSPPKDVAKSATSGKRHRQSLPKDVAKAVSPEKKPRQSPPKSGKRQRSPSSSQEGKRQKFDLDELANSLADLNNSDETEAKPIKPETKPSAPRRSKKSTMMIDPSRRSSRSTTKPDRFTPGEAKSPTTKNVKASKSTGKTKSEIKKDDKKKKTK